MKFCVNEESMFLFHPTHHTHTLSLIWSDIKQKADVLLLCGKRAHYCRCMANICSTMDVSTGCVRLWGDWTQCITLFVPEAVDVGGVCSEDHRSLDKSMPSRHVHMLNLRPPLFWGKYIALFHSGQQTWRCLWGLSTLCVECSEIEGDVILTCKFPYVKRVQRSVLSCNSSGAPYMMSLNNGCVLNWGQYPTPWSSCLWSAVTTEATLNRTHAVWTGRWPREQKFDTGGPPDLSLWLFN